MKRTKRPNPDGSTVHVLEQAFIDAAGARQLAVSKVFIMPDDSRSMIAGYLRQGRRTVRLVVKHGQLPKIQAYISK